MAGSSPRVPTTRPGRLWHRTIGALRVVEKCLRPGRRAWRGAATGLAMGAGILIAALVYYGVLRPSASWGRVLGTAQNMGWGLALAAAIALTLWVATKLPRRFRGTLIVVVAMLGPVFGNIDDSPLPLLAYLLFWVLAGAGLGVISGTGWPRLSLLRRAVAFVGLLVGLGGIVASFVFLADDGMPALPVHDAARSVEALPAPLSLPDPSSPGPYPVLHLTYGSGTDHRHEFGRDADLVTETVDGTDFVSNREGWAGWAREKFWGFDFENLPLQGRVWYPDGPGPFPLVLVVHGNHAMDDFSDPGYAYLGEMLASRGIITVSVDENFINGLSGENDARGWLLLEHLRVWREWSRSEGHVVGQRVDMTRIGLIGHSRGGEAVAVAAAFNRLSHYPDDATVAFDYDFDIGAVIAIAPVYGQYRPAGVLTPLQDVNYLVLHGANDGDVSSFNGSAQYEAVTYSGSEYGFKAAVYIYGANHGQFNTSWGDRDWGLPFGLLLNTEALMPGEEQRQAARVFISAFLEAALRDRIEYLPLFTDPRRADPWLPDTVYLADFRDSRFRTLADFDEDLDVTTATLAGARIEGVGLTRWREDRVGLKFGNKATNAAYVGWQQQEGEAPARYTIRLDGGHDISTARALVMSLADADESPEPKKRGDDEGNEEQGASNGNHAQDDDAEENDTDDEADDEADEDDDDDAPREPIDVTVRLVDLDGRSAAVPLSRFSPVQAQLAVQTLRSVFGEARKRSEVVYQTFDLPLEWFLEADPLLDLQRLGAVEFVFDRSEEGVLVIDDVGFAPR